MFDRLNLELSHEDGVPRFTFAHPVTIYMFIVVEKDVGKVWEFSPTEMQPSKVARAQFTHIPLADVHPETIKQLGELANREGGFDKPVATIKYGVVPAGYREDVSPQRLKHGSSYNVMMIGKEGHASATFDAK